MTNFRALDLFVDEKIDIVMNVAPNIEIKKLGNLKARSGFLINLNKEFIFGGKKQLIRLEVQQDFFCPPPSSTITLQATSAFAYYV